MTAKILSANYQPEFESLRERLLELARLRSVDELMRRVVTLLAERPHVALARIWLLDRGDQCQRCARCEACLSHEACLHLAASAGRPFADHRSDWSRLDGEFSRIPLGKGKIGRVGETGEAVVIRDLAEDTSVLAHPDWAIAEGIHGFNAQPILFDQRVLGVLAIFTRIPVPEESPAWLRIFADHIASALVNARAFEEIERLRARLELENTYLREEIREARAFGDLIGESPVMRTLQEQINLVAPTDASVLVLGESGTGKELVAREIHRRSARAAQPLIRVNCASVPRELFESEFFGHVKGAFTGAVKDRAGRFEAADGGTLFLDEVGEIPLELQSKFLRVLQERQYERVGDDRTRTVNVRIIAATNRDLKAEVEAGRFRQDLFYRLNVFPITVPPLRERLDDVPLLAGHFLAQSARRLRVPLPRLLPEHLAQLQRYAWPGNVRELQNTVEHALIMARGGALKFDLPAGEPGVPPPAAPEIREEHVLTEAELQDLERRNLAAALRQTKWKIHGPNGTAELLGVKPTTLISRIKKLGLKRPE